MRFRNHRRFSPHKSLRNLTGDFSIPPRFLPRLDA
jgi:hypothetical protein